EEKALLRRRGYENPAFFCCFFLRHWFPTTPEKMPWMHKGLLAILRNKVAWLEEYPEDLEKIQSNFLIETSSGPVPIFVRDENGNLTLFTNQHIAEIIPRGYAKTTVCNASS